MTVTVKIVEDPARACADQLLEAASGEGHVVLTGGSTPRAAYELAAAEPAAWAGATVWFGDERCVGPDDERSNFAMAKAALFDHLPDGEGGPLVKRIPGERGPEVAALAFERLLADAGPPAFNLLLLGIGSDGHIASMFPNQASLDERSRLVVGVPEAGLSPFVPRVSMTFPAIALALRVLVLATGAGKAVAVARAFGNDASPTRELPASLLPAHAASLTVLLDADAAAGL